MRSRPASGGWPDAGGARWNSTTVRPGRATTFSKQLPTRGAVEVDLLDPVLVAKQLGVGCRQPVGIFLRRNHGDCRRVRMKTQGQIDGFTKSDRRGQAGHAGPGVPRELPSGQSGEGDWHTGKDRVAVLEGELEG